MLGMVPAIHAASRGTAIRDAVRFFLDGGFLPSLFSFEPGMEIGVRIRATTLPPPLALPLQTARATS